MVAQARRTNLCKQAPLIGGYLASDIGMRIFHDGVMYELVTDNEIPEPYWLPLHPLTLYGEAMRDLQQMLNDRRKIDAQTSATDDTQAS